MAENTMINTTFPVDLPDFPELKLSKTDFEAYLKKTFAKPSRDIELPIHTKTDATADPKVAATAEQDGSRFMDGLLGDAATVPSFDDRDGKMLTENADVAHRTSGQALVDLFYEAEEVVAGDRLSTLLEKAWKNDSDATLKIIWNARSIHLGKSSRNTFYRALGWLAEQHPLTLLTNLPWMVRPIIQKKAPKPAEAKDADGKAKPADVDSDYEMIDEDGEVEGQPQAKKLKLDNEDAKFDVKYGVAHGYWKDLLNILALAANDELKADGKPRNVLNVEKVKTKAYKKDWTPGQKKQKTSDRHDRVVEKLENDPFYKALHTSVARLFADQLQLDLERLNSGNKADVKSITLAAKWAPSHKGMHDQHTCIVTSIAELLYTFDSVCPEADPADRTLYIKHAREAYQTKTLSPLRKVLNVVERPISDKKYEDIKYERVPSLAMKQYTPLFAQKDHDRFDEYIDKVAQGKARISGAVLLPSTLVASVSGSFAPARANKKSGANGMVEQKLREMQAKTVDGQWKTLVQRIKDSGTLESSIAVCDVSGSMTYPKFPDGTCPMDSAVGLSLLLAEVTKPPFGGCFITFHDNPAVLQAGGESDKRSLQEKVDYIKAAPWGMSTDFVAVFEKLILPMAVKNKLSQEDMVKQVFVFSDMQFNAAESGSWETSYERIAKKYKEAGYEMPKLIFWNLAGGRAGYEGTGGDPVAPKPVTACEENTALVSGYSQGQLKMFLENGQFDEPEAEEEVVEKEGEDGEVVVEKTKKKADPLTIVMTAISHEAYRMLQAVD